MLKSLRGKLMIIIGVFVLILITSSLFLLYNQSKNILKENINESAIRQVNNNAKIISNWLAGIEAQISNLSKTESVKKMEWEFQEEMLSDIADSHEYIQGLYVADINGDYQITSGEGGNISDRPYFQKAMKSGGNIYSSPIISKATGDQIVVIGSTIVRENETVGFIATTINLEYLQDLIKDMKIAGHGNGWLIDNEKRTIAHPTTEYLGDKSILEAGNQEFNNIANKMVRGESGISNYELENTKKMMAYAPIEVTGWSVAIGAETQEILSPLNVIRQSSLLIGVISILVGLGIAYFIANYIAKPIKAVTDIITKISNFNLEDNNSHKFTKYLDRNDEIGRITNSVTKMQSNFIKIIKITKPNFRKTT